MVSGSDEVLEVESKHLETKINNTEIDILFFSNSKI